MELFFVADSQEEMKDSNIDTMKEMQQYLSENGLNPKTIPLILQFNKRDLNNILSPEEMYQDISRDSEPFVNAKAIDSIGVLETLMKISELTVNSKDKAL